MEGWCFGSFFVRVDDDGVEVTVACGKKGNFRCLSVVLSEHVSACGANAVECELVVVWICFDNNCCTCRNVKLDKCARLHVEGVCVTVPCNVAVFRTDKKTIPLQCCTFTNGCGCVECVRCASCTFVTVKVEVLFVIYNNFGGLGVPWVKVGNSAVGCTKDNCKVSVVCCLVGCEHCHTGNCFGNGTCACVVVLNKLNSFVSWVNTVHGDVSLVFVVCLVVAINGDVFAKFGVDNCNCSVCAPSTADCCFACHYAFVSGKLTTIEDCAVYDSIVCTLVGALESCDVACCAGVILACVNHVDCAVFEVACAVCTEDKVGVAGDEHLFEVVTTCEQLECILDCKETTVLHCEHVCLNEQCKVTFDCKSCFVKSCLTVPVVGDCNTFDNAVYGLFTYCYCCGGVGCVSETTCVI